MRRDRSGGFAAGTGAKLGNQGGPTQAVGRLEQRCRVNRVPLSPGLQDAHDSVCDEILAKYRRRVALSFMRSNSSAWMQGVTVSARRSVNVGVELLKVHLMIGDAVISGALVVG